MEYAQAGKGLGWLPKKNSRELDLRARNLVERSREIVLGHNVHESTLSELRVEFAKIVEALPR